MNVALLEKGGGKKYGAKPGADQQAGQGDDQPQFSIPLFKLRELLADPRQNSFCLSMHYAGTSKIPISRHSLAASNVSRAGTKVMKREEIGPMDHDFESGERAGRKLGLAPVGGCRYPMRNC